MAHGINTDDRLRNPRGISTSSPDERRAEAPGEVDVLERDAAAGPGAADQQVASPVEASSSGRRRRGSADDADEDLVADGGRADDRRPPVGSSRW